MPKSPESLMPASAQAQEKQGRLLTREDKEKLEQEGTHVIEDSLDVLYCASDDRFPSRSALGTIDVKPMIFLAGYKDVPGEATSLSDAIDVMLRRGGEVDELLKKYNFSTDRSIMDKLGRVGYEKLLTEKEIKLAEEISHNNRFEFVFGFPARESQPRFNKVCLFVSSKERKGYDLPLSLEICSAFYLEPHFRSSRTYKEENLDEDKLEILENMDVLRREYDKGGPYSQLKLTVNKYFDGDLEAFQKRWQEFYRNWWPKEFEGMRDTEQKWLDWLKSLKEKI